MPRGACSIDTKRGMCVFDTRVLGSHCPCPCPFNRHDASRCQSLHTCGLLSLWCCVLVSVNGSYLSGSFPHVVLALPWLAARAVILRPPGLAPIRVGHGHNETNNCRSNDRLRLAAPSTAAVAAAAAAAMAVAAAAATPALASARLGASPAAGLAAESSSALWSCCAARCAFLAAPEASSAMYATDVVCSWR